MFFYVRTKNTKFSKIEVNHSQMDKINTIVSNSEYKFKEKGSLFIGEAFIIESINEAEEILNATRKKYYDATHNCYAYKLIEDEDIKYSDDGEPNGTAGIRILNAINHFGLSNILIISTRYYGGTKLGVGPLGKAYYNSALGALQNTEIVTKENHTKILINFGYDFISDVHHFINKYKAKEIKNLFENNPKIECLIKPIHISEIEKELQALSGNKIEIKIVKENLFL